MQLTGVQFLINKMTLTLIGIPDVLSRNFFLPLFLLLDEYDDQEKENTKSKLLNINNIDCSSSKICPGSGKQILSDVVIGKCAKVYMLKGKH